MDTLIRKDGYINLNKLCKYGNRDFRTWKRSRRAKEFLIELSTYLNIPKDELIKYTIYTSTDKANWGHPQVATYVAQWISVKFSVQISIWIEEWKVKHNNKNRYEYELSDIEGYISCKDKEKQVQLSLYKKLNGKIEVKTPDGFIDILTDTEIIEVKCMKNWKHAVGQILIYGEYYPNHIKRIHLFDIIEDEINRIKTKLSVFNIILTYEI